MLRTGISGDYLINWVSSGRIVSYPNGNVELCCCYGLKVIKSGDEKAFVLIASCVTNVE